MDRRGNQPPDAEKRRNFDEYAGQTIEQAVKRARAHWFMTYADILDRYGSPDSVVLNDNGAVSVGYILPNGFARITFQDGVVVGIQTH